MVVVFIYTPLQVVPSQTDSWERSLLVMSALYPVSPLPFSWAESD